MLRDREREGRGNLETFFTLTIYIPVGVLVFFLFVLDHVDLWALCEQLNQHIHLCVDWIPGCLAVHAKKLTISPNASHASIHRGEYSLSSSLRPPLSFFFLLILRCVPEEIPIFVERLDEKRTRSWSAIWLQRLFVAFVTTQDSALRGARNQAVVTRSKAVGDVVGRG